RVLVNFGLGELRKVEHLPRTHHGFGQIGGLSRIEPAKIDRHQKRRTLVVRDSAPRVALDELQDFFAREHLAVALLPDQSRNVLLQFNATPRVARIIHLCPPSKKRRYSIPCLSRVFLFVPTFSYPSAPSELRGLRPPS